MKYKWGNHYGETYRPKRNKLKVIGCISFISTAITLDAVIPGTFGMITKKAYQTIKRNIGWMYN